MKKNVNVNSENVNGINNAKVSNISYKFYKVGTQGFLNEGGVVINVTVTKVLVDLRNKVVTTTLKDVKGREYTRTGEFEMYASSYDYENSTKIKRFIYDASELLRKAGGTRTHTCRTYVIDVEENKETGEVTSNIFMELWVMENGNAVAIPAQVNAVAWDENGWSLADGTLPEKYWDSKYNLYKWNEYKVIDEDGDEFIEQSAEIRLAPTDAQKDILNELSGVIAKANGAGLHLFIDNSGDVCAINTANLLKPEDAGKDCASCGDDIFIGDVEVSCLKTGFAIGKGFSVKLVPTPRQLKAWKKSHPDSKC